MVITRDPTKDCELNARPIGPPAASTSLALRDRTPAGFSPPFEFRHKKNHLSVVFIGDPTGIRTPVTAVKGRCPRPLDDGVIVR